MNFIELEKRFFINSEKIELNLGTIEFKKVNEYKKVSQYMSLLQVAEHQVKERVYASAKEMDVYSETALKEFMYKLKNTSMYNIIQQNPEPIRGTIYSKENYNQMFDYFFVDWSENKLEMIGNQKVFNQLRDIIIEIHGQEPDREPTDIRLADYNRKKKELMMRSGASASFESMYTSVYAYTGADPDEMTIYKFHKLFERINQIFSYESNIHLLPNMPKDKVEVRPWYADPKTEKPMISKEEFKKRANSKKKI